MKCRKCGAEIPAGCLYCSVCGSEVQLVPDYNLLDDDILSGIIQREAGSGGSGGKQAAKGTAFRKKEGKAVKREKTFHGKKARLSGIICAVLLVLILMSVLAYRNVQKRHWNSYGYQYQKAEECFGSKEWKDAVRHYERSLALKPGDPKAGMRLCDVYLALDEEDAAVAVLEELVPVNPQNESLLEKLVGLYEKNGQYDEILALSREAEGSGAERIFADFKTEPPAFGKRPGIYSEAIRVEITSDRSYDIFYTEDGSDPVQNGAPYAGAVPLKNEGTTVISAVSRNKKGIYSEVARASYTIRYLPPEMPKVMPEGGTYEEARMITVEVPENCAAYYTWDGSDPTEESPVYAGPLEMMPGNRVLSVMLVNASGLKSGIYRVNYVYMP